MDEVFDEVTDDGIKNTHQDRDGNEQVEDIGRQVDSIPRGGYIALKEHSPVFFLVTNVEALRRHIHCCQGVFKTAVSQGIHLIPHRHRCIEGSRHKGLILQISTITSKYCILQL